MDEIKEKPTELEAIAYHEAGHAVAAYFHDVQVISIYVQNTGGCVKKEKPVPADNPTHESLMRKIVNELIFLQAGAVAHEIFNNGKMKVGLDQKRLFDSLDGASKDLEAMIYIKNIAGELGASLSALKTKASGIAWRTIDDNWVAVEALASVLLEEREISGKRARNIIRDQLSTRS